MIYLLIAAAAKQWDNPDDDRDNDDYRENAHGSTGFKNTDNGITAA